MLDELRHQSAHAPSDPCARDAQPDRVAPFDHPHEELRRRRDIARLEACSSHEIDQIGSTPPRFRSQRHDIGLVLIQRWPALPHQTSSMIKTAMATTVVHRPSLLPSAVWTILREVNWHVLLTR